MAQPFYDRLYELNLTNTLPANMPGYYSWGNGQTTNDYALANIGQAKYVFSFDSAKDSDSDGMPDWWETAHNLNPYADDASLDPDNDGLTNLEEYQYGTDPNNADTDGDGMPDGWEVEHGLNPLVNDASLDPDNDGLTNLQEYQYGTDPHNPDTDGDGLSDAWEVAHGTDPLDWDTDGDGLSDGWEVTHGYNPLNSSDGNEMLVREAARQNILRHWMLFNGWRFEFTNTPGSAADLNDMKWALNLLSCCFYKVEFTYETLYYHLNRKFTPISIYIEGTPTVYQLHTEAEKLTDIVQGLALQFDMNNTYAIERNAAAICYTTATGAWDAAVAYNGTPSNYPGKIYDNCGWVRGTITTNGEWGAYFWTLQNHLAFKTSESNWWRHIDPAGVFVAITNVFVGSLGNYGPTSDVVDIGPSLILATNFPGADCGEAKEYKVDITNIFYQVAIPDIWITPRMAATAVGSSNVQYSVFGINIPTGVTWSIIPVLTNGAEIYPSNDWHYASVTPGNVSTNYKVRAASMDNASFYDEVNLAVYKIDIVESNVYVAVSNTVALHLTADSTADAEWEIIPDLESQGGAYFEGSESGASVDINAGSLPTNYIVKAYATVFTNCFDTCSVTVIKISLTNMTFSMGWDLTRDIGGTYPSPHWSTTNSSPYLYERSTQVNVTATFNVEPSNFTGNIIISGDGSGDLGFTNVTVSASGGLAIYPATDSIGMLTNYVDYWNPMQINWKYNVGVSSNCYAGSSSNMIFVCLADPSGVPTLYHTVVHLACSVGHATNEAQAVSNTWSQLIGHNFTTWDGRTLYYYQSGIAWASNITDVSGLLANGNGQCNSWRELLEKAWLVNGVISTGATVSTVANPGSEIFLVKNWGFNTPTLTNDPPFNYVFLITASNGSMVGVGNFGDVNNLSGIPGQNSSTPAEKAFGYHFIQKYGGIYYDPSYGAIYTNDADFQAQAVTGFGEINPDNPNTNFPGMVEFGVKQTTNTMEVKIVP